MTIRVTRACAAPAKAASMAPAATILPSPDPTMRTSRFIRRDDRSTVANGCGSLAELARVRISRNAENRSACSMAWWLRGGRRGGGLGANYPAARAAAACYDFRGIGPPHRRGGDRRHGRPGTVQTAPGFTRGLIMTTL